MTHGDMTTMTTTMVTWAKIGHDGDVMTMGSDGGYDDANDDSVS